MAHNRVDISEGWQLGWCRETKLNRWLQVYNYWDIEAGRLRGRRGAGWGQARICANCSPEGDYDYSCSLLLPEQESSASVCLLYSAQRYSYYGVNIRPGGRIGVHYIFSDLFDHSVLEEAGPVLETGREYAFRAELRGETVTLYLDGEQIASFEADCPSGRQVAFCVTGGTALFGNVAYTQADGGQLLFSDDFSENSLADFAEVELEELNSGEWLSAEIPGSVHSSLLKAGRIEDPYYGYNGPKQLWVDDQRWIYKKRFKVPKGMRGKNLRLVFDGVDYRALFWLNGKKLCYHEGMFGGPDLDITELADYENENELTVCILPCPTPPHNNVRPYILHRWHFNMDIVTVGIWRKVQLVANDKIFLSDPQVITKSIRDNKAVVQVSVSVGNMAMWPFDVQGRVTLRSPDPQDPPVTGSFAPGFFQGCLRVSCELEVPNPRLWWPNGMGEQHLYDVDITADIFEQSAGPLPTGHDELHLRTGLRTLRMEPAPSPHLPEHPAPVAKTSPYGLYNWCLSVNGRPFFGKGSNWMPIDQMLRLPRERYELLLRRARDCNVNLLRPWGAGLLETDDFYELCDELGICVWQETLMANGFYDQSDRQVWRETLRANVSRLRNHPSLVMWCGGNEFDPDCPENRDLVDEIESICGELDPTREFHRASPYGGDSHSYLVNWMGGMDYTQYTNDLSVAVTEFSMASPPSMDTLKKIVPPEELETWPPDLPDDIHRHGYAKWGENVSRRESGYSLHDAHLSSITNVMLPFMSDCGVPSSWEEFIRYMQTSHGLLTQFGNDVWRSRWPHCTMAMSWVFNVIFPDTLSWSYVDYFGVPKRSYYYKKRSFEPLHAGAIFDHLFNRPGDTFRAKLFVANDTLEKHGGASLKIRLYDSSLRLLASSEKSCDVHPDDVKHCGWFTWRIPSDMEPGALFLCVDLLDEAGRLLSRSQYCPRVGEPRERMPYLENGPWISDVSRAKTELEAEPLPAGEEGTLRIRIENTGPLPAFQVSLESPGNEERLTYSDNYFWLEAGEAREIGITSRGGAPEVLELSAWNAEKRSVPIP